MEMNAPIKLELSIYAVNHETGTQATLNVSLPLGQYPTPDTIRELIKKNVALLPEGYELMNKKEFFNAYLAEEYGSQETFATPGSPDFDETYVQGTQ